MCLGGILYLTFEYGKYLSELGKLIILVLITATFTSLGKYFEMAKKSLKRWIKLHSIFYGFSATFSICTYAFFLTMKISTFVKIFITVILGVAIILLARRFKITPHRAPTHRILPKSSTLIQTKITS